MTFKERKQDKMGLGLPDISKHIDTQTNPLLGTKSKLGLDKSHASREAKDGLKTGTEPTKKHGILGSTISLKESSVALIEQLLNSSKGLIEEFERNVNVNTVSTGASGAAGEGKGVPHTNYSAVLNRNNDASQAKRDDTRQRQDNNADTAADIKPGTGRVINSHSVTASNAKMQGALNNQQTQSRLAQEAEAKAQEQQG